MREWDQGRNIEHPNLGGVVGEAARPVREGEADEAERDEFRRDCRGEPEVSADRLLRGQEGQVQPDYDEHDPARAVVNRQSAAS